MRLRDSLPYACVVRVDGLTIRPLLCYPLDQELVSPVHLLRVIPSFTAGRSWLLPAGAIRGEIRTSKHFAVKLTRCFKSPEFPFDRLCVVTPAKEMPCDILMSSEHALIS